MLVKIKQLRYKMRKMQILGRIMRLHAVDHRDDNSCDHKKQLYFMKKKLTIILHIMMSRSQSEVRIW